MNASVLRRLEQLEAEAASLRPPPGERPGCWELLNWMTCGELTQIEQMLRDAGVDTVGELGVAALEKLIAETRAAGRAGAGAGRAQQGAGDHRGAHGVGCGTVGQGLKCARWVSCWLSRVLEDPLRRDT